MNNSELKDRLLDYKNRTEEDIIEAALRLEKMSNFLRHNAFATKQFGVFFICGEAGEKDQNGIPEQIHICPAYGSDVVYRYVRDPNQKVFAPEW
jgi:hypothetical protein